MRYGHEQLDRAAKEKPDAMKVLRLTDSKKQHMVAIELKDDLRCYYKDASKRIAGSVASELRIAIANHDISHYVFQSLPRIVSRISRHGQIIFDMTD